jgi:hypothetical protein
VKRILRPASATAIFAAQYIRPFYSWRMFFFTGTRLERRRERE